MKKILYAIILIISLFSLFSEEQENLTKNQDSLSLIIIPFFNITALKEFDYISQEIKNSLEQKINDYNYFDIYDWQKAEDTFYLNNFDYNKLIFEDDQDTIKKLLGIDLSIVGFYKITTEYIHIYFKCFEKKDKVESFTFEYLNDYNENKIKEYIEYSTKTMAKMVIDKYKLKINVKNKILDFTYLSKKKKLILARNISGYTLLGSGIALSIAGFVTLGIDLGNYYEENNKAFNNLISKKTQEAFSKYEQLSLTYTSLFLSASGIINLGLSSSLMSLPLFLYSKREMNLKNKIGFSLYTMGVYLFGTGLFFTIFTTAFYYQYWLDSLNAYNNKLIDKTNYELIYNSYIAFLVTGISSTAVGLIMAFVAVPFLLNREKNIKKSSFSFIINYKKDLELSFVYNF